MLLRTSLAQHLLLQDQCDPARGPTSLLPPVWPHDAGQRGGGSAHHAPNPWTRAASTAPQAQAGRACWPCSSELKPCQVCCIYFNLGLLTATWVRKRFLVSANPVPYVHTNTLAQCPRPAPSSQQFGLLPSLLALNSCSQNCCTNGCHYCLICSQIHSCPFKPICSFARII